MTPQSPDARATARTYCSTAAEGFSDLAGYLRSIGDDTWTGPSSCAKWTVRDLAAHAVGEAVWFPNLIRGATHNEAPVPASFYEEVKAYSRGQMADTLDRAAAEFDPAISGATDENLQALVDLGFAKMPLWQATYISAFEAAFHGWDARAVAEPDATIPTGWAVTVAGGLANLAPGIAHRTQLAGASGTFLLNVGDGVGPVTVRFGGGDLHVESGADSSPDVTLHLSADQYDRIITGRLKLDSELPRDRVQIDGDRDRALGLNRVFGGVANEE